MPEPLFLCDTLTPILLHGPQVEGWGGGVAGRGGTPAVTVQCKKIVFQMSSQELKDLMGQLPE